MSALAARMGGREITDEALVGATRRGDDAAFEVLYLRYGPRLTAFAGRMVRDGRAEDVVQEAFVSALRKLRSDVAPIDFKPWIYEIVRNRAIDQIRRGRRTQLVSIDTGGDALVAASSPPDSAIAREDLERLCGAFGELADAQSRVLVLRELEGRSYREIAQTLGVTQAAVESTLFRARRRLAIEYAKLEDGTRCRTVIRALVRIADAEATRADQRAAARHVPRCAECRRHAHDLGIDPRRLRLPARVAGMLPAFIFGRRRIGGDQSAAATGAGPVAQSGGGAGIWLVPASETVAGGIVSAVAVLGSAVLIGGAALTGAGPFERFADRPVAGAPAATTTTSPGGPSISPGVPGSPVVGPPGSGGVRADRPATDRRALPGEVGRAELIAPPPLPGIPAARVPPAELLDPAVAFPPVPVVPQLPSVPDLPAPALPAEGVDTVPADVQVPEIALRDLVLPQVTPGIPELPGLPRLPLP